MNQMSDEHWRRMAEAHEAWLTTRVLPDQLLVYASNWHNRHHPNGRPADEVDMESKCPTCGLLSIAHPATWAGHVVMENGKVRETYTYALCTGDRVKL